MNQSEASSADVSESDARWSDERRYLVADSILTFFGSTFGIIGSFIDAKNVRFDQDKARDALRNNMYGDYQEAGNYEIVVGERPAQRLPRWQGWDPRLRPCFNASFTMSVLTAVCDGFAAINAFVYAGIAKDIEAGVFVSDHTRRLVEAASLILLVSLQGSFQLIGFVVISIAIAFPEKVRYSDVTIAVRNMLGAVPPLWPVSFMLLDQTCRD